MAEKTKIQGTCEKYIEGRIVVKCLEEFERNAILQSKNDFE